MTKPVIIVAVFPTSVLLLLIGFICGGFSGHIGTLSGQISLVIAGVVSAFGFLGGILLVLSGRVFWFTGQTAPISGLPEGEVNKELVDAGTGVMFFGRASVLLGMLGFFATIGSAIWIKFLCC